MPFFVARRSFCKNGSPQGQLNKPCALLTACKDGVSVNFQNLTCFAALMRAKNSFLVFSSFKKSPRSAEVVVVAFAFCTPRICIQKCLASMTTPTPFAPMCVLKASAICSVSCSWICKRLANISTRRGILESPTTFLSGI